LLVFGLLYGISYALTEPAQHSMSDHTGHDMSKMDAPLTPAQQAKLLADKKESEFNHHLAGFFVALGGAFILFQGPLGRRLNLEIGRASCRERV